MSDLQKVGSDWGGAGTFKPFTSGVSGAQRAQNAHGLYADATLAGRMFFGGTATLLSIANATFTIATLGATATPIIGLWNPLSSGVYLNILQATLAQVMTAVAATGPGPLFWAGIANQGALTLGSIPFNRRTLQVGNSAARVFAGAALTGLANNLVVMGGSAMGGGSAENASFTATAVAMQTQMQAYVENFDGSLIVPPGGVIALLASTTPVAHSVSSSLLWEETPLLVQV